MTSCTGFKSHPATPRRGIPDKAASGRESVPPNELVLIKLRITVSDGRSTEKVVRKPGTGSCIAERLIRDAVRVYLSCRFLMI